VVACVAPRQLNVETLTAESARLAAELQRATGDAVATVGDATSTTTTAAAAATLRRASASADTPPPPPATDTLAAAAARVAVAAAVTPERGGGGGGGGGGSGDGHAGDDDTLLIVRREYELRLKETEAQRAALAVDLEVCATWTVIHCCVCSTASYHCRHEGAAPCGRSPCHGVHPACKPVAAMPLFVLCRRCSQRWLALNSDSLPEVHNTR
jgi:hypothetical protein